MKEHPIISIYSKAEADKIPLILIIGREPNGPIGTKINPRLVSEYASKEWRPGSFWNISYSVLSELASDNQDKSWLRSRSRETGMSPIIYANALYETLNYSSSKYRQRKEMIENLKDLERHIGNIFRNKYIERVELIICSGLEMLQNIAKEQPIPESNRPEQIIRKYAEIYSNAKDIIMVDYFCPRNRKKIFEELSKEGNKKEIRRIINQSIMYAQPNRISLN